MMELSAKNVDGLKVVPSQMFDILDATERYLPTSRKIQIKSSWASIMKTKKCIYSIVFYICIQNVFKVYEGSNETTLWWLTLLVSLLSTGDKLKKGSSLYMVDFQRLFVRRFQQTSYWFRGLFRTQWNIQDGAFSKNS